MIGGEEGRRRMERMRKRKGKVGGEESRGRKEGAPSS
jgi:hypothetical protein